LHKIIFAHHPCPDGLASCAILSDSYGFGGNVTYVGLNYSTPENMRDEIFAIVHMHLAEALLIIFVDVVPEVEVLIDILGKKPDLQLVVLDHHETAIQEISQKKPSLQVFIDQKRLDLRLTPENSGVGLAHQFVYPDAIAPNYVTFIQTMDLLTATSNPKVIKNFSPATEYLNSRQLEILDKLANISNNAQISQNILFYFLCCGIDEYIKSVHKKNNFRNSVVVFKSFCDKLMQEGFKIIFDMKIEFEGKIETVETIFLEQLKRQTALLQEAVLIASLHSKEMDVLFLPVYIQDTGRTFEPLVVAALQAQKRPTIAMISKPADLAEINSVSLRAGDSSVDLIRDVLRPCQKLNLMMDGGGHARAAVLRLNRKQMLEILDRVNLARYQQLIAGIAEGRGLTTQTDEQPKNSPFRSKL